MEMALSLWIRKAKSYVESEASFLKRWAAVPVGSSPCLEKRHHTREIWARVDSLQLVRDDLSERETEDMHYLRGKGFPFITRALTQI